MDLKNSRELAKRINYLKGLKPHFTSFEEEFEKTLTLKKIREPENIELPSNYNDIIFKIMRIFNIINNRINEKLNNDELLQMKNKIININNKDINNIINIIIDYFNYFNSYIIYNRENYFYK